MPVTCEVSDGVAMIRVRGATKVNAMTHQMYHELEDIVFRQIDVDPKIKVGILIGDGENFSVGHDLKSAQEHIDSGANDDIYGVTPFYFKPFPEILSRRMYTPLVGATRGWVLGAAMTYYGLHCSLRIAGESSKFGYTEIKRGLVGASIMAQTTSQLPYALHMLMSATGDHIDATTALAGGFVNEVVKDEHVERRAVEVADLVARNPRLTVRAQKMLQIKGQRMPQEARALLAHSTWTLNTVDQRTFAKVRGESA